MCTLSFIPESGGYLIGMNRDEHLLRETALPPRISEYNGVPTVYPREQRGGTWIGANGARITFALLNRNPAPETAKLRSRGDVIPALLGSIHVSQAVERMRSLDLHGLFPFRLVAFFAVERVVVEWNWDNDLLQLVEHPWHRRHWFSSGISDDSARRVRGSTCSAAWRHQNAGSLEWLRDLHASHAPSCGPFSICVHRPDAASVSYTEISYREPELTMRYHIGQPCERMGRIDAEITLRLAEPPLRAAMG
jgi:Transport and Golgi organisation 2